MSQEIVQLTDTDGDTIRLTAPDANVVHLSQRRQNAVNAPVESLVFWNQDFTQIAVAWLEHIGYIITANRMPLLSP